MRIKHLFSRILLGLAATFSAATPAVANSDVTGRVYSIQSYPGHNGTLVSIAQPYSTSEGCLGTIWYIFPDDSIRAAAVQAMLLSALASRMPLTVTLQGCYQNYPKIVAVTLTAP